MQQEVPFSWCVHKWLCRSRRGVASNDLSRFDWESDLNEEGHLNDNNNKVQELPEWKPHSGADLQARRGNYMCSFFIKDHILRQEEGIACFHDRSRIKSIGKERESRVSILGQGSHTNARRGNRVYLHSNITSAGKDGPQASASYTFRFLIGVYVLPYYHMYYHVLPYILQCITYDL